MKKVCFVVDINMPVGSIKTQCQTMGYKIKNLLSTLQFHTDPSGKTPAQTAPGSLVVCTDQLYTKLLGTITSCFLFFPRTELVLSDDRADGNLAAKSYAEQYSILSTLKAYLQKCTYCGAGSPVPVISSYFPQGQANQDTEAALSQLGVQNVGFLPIGAFNQVVPNIDLQENLMAAFDTGADLIIYIDVQSLPYPYVMGNDTNYAGLGPVIDYMKANGAKFVTMGEFYNSP